MKTQTELYQAYCQHFISQGMVPMTFEEWVKMNEHFDKAEELAKKALEEWGD